MRKDTLRKDPAQGFRPKGDESLAHLFGEDPLTEAIRREIGAVIEKVLAEELAMRLGAGPYTREEFRAGYRNGTERRRLVTSWGPTEFSRPRGRVWKADGTEEEAPSDLLPRYQRRSRKVDQQIIAMYFGGVNTRKVKGVLRTLGATENLSASAVSRVIQSVKAHFEEWQSRSLRGDPIVYLYLDAIGVKTHLAGRVVSRSILVAVGVREDGQKVLLGLWSMGSESEEAWKSVLEDLVARGLRRPLLAMVDGCPGLRAALDQVWAGIDVQRCAVHKLRNLLRYAPKHAHDEVRNDFHSIVYAENAAKAQEAYEAFVIKWKKLCASVAKSLEEAGAELLTFYRYPKSQWKALRTTNVIERLNGEFRRRVKTQSSLPNEAAVLVLLYGLVASGFVRLRKITGYRLLWKVLKEHPGQAA